VKFRIILLIFIILLPAAFYAKDIDLDAIYIKKDSILYNRIVEKKFDAYDSANSYLLDRGVIHAFWATGSEIVYIREKGEINIIYLFNRRKHRKYELTRQRGAVTAARMSPNGKYLFFKRILRNRKGQFFSQMVMFNIRTRMIKLKSADYPFLDFSFSPGGNSIIFSDRGRMVELYPESEIKKNIPVCPTVRRHGLSGHSFVYFSPNRLKTLYLNGRGGGYSSSIMSENRAWKVRGITSGSEVAWLDNRYIVYRGGRPWAYSVGIYDTVKKHRKEILSVSFNTCINYSYYPEIITFLKDQLICLYDFRSGLMHKTGIEGEDVSFSPDGNTFISLLYTGLFVSRKADVIRHETEIRRAAKELKRLYTEAAQSPSLWENDFTFSYLRRKVSAYSHFLNAK